MPAFVREREGARACPCDVWPTAARLGILGSGRISLLPRCAPCVGLIRHPFIARTANQPADELMKILEDGRSLASKGRLDEAVDRYDRALELDPDCLLACVAKAIALMEMEMPGRALELLEGFKIREDDPLASRAFFQKGMALYYLGRPDESISCLDMVKRPDSNYADSRFNKAVVLEDCYDVGRRHGRLEEALLCYDEAVAAKPNFPDALYNRGLLLVKLGRMGDAVESYDEAIRLAPGFCRRP